MVGFFFSLPSFHKHIGKSIQLEAKYFSKLSTGIRNVVINELLFPISILCACCCSD